MPTCQQAAREIASDNFVAAPWRQRLAVRLHLLLCKHCRRYARQLGAIGDAARVMFASDGDDLETIGRLEDRVSEDLERIGRPGEFEPPTS